MDEADRIDAGIAALESQRPQLGDVVVDTAQASLRARLVVLRGAESAQQIRQVTVLFADIASSTALSGVLDPEEIHAIVNGAMVRFTRVVQVRGGRVLQYAGDSLLAVFGADVSQEDDAERAVHAGLEMLREAALTALDVCARYGFEGFGVRVGIHTGAVLLGGGVEAEGSIRGAAVNIAARMEQTAPIGGLRISHDTYRHVRGVFVVQTQPPLEVKGVTEPLVTYVVNGTRPRAFRAATRGIEGVEVRMVGRDAELDRLVARFEQVGLDRMVGLTMLIGDAGLGKTRLIAEFEHLLERRPETIALFQGRAHPQALDAPYGLLRDMLFWRFELRDSDSFDEAHRRMLGSFGSVFGERAEEQTALVGQLIGLDYRGSPHIAGILQDSKQLRDRAFHALSQFFRLLCVEDADRIVLILDDLHWADAGSLDFIEYFAKTGAGVPALLLCAARPTLYERRPSWGADRTSCERIDLMPLSRDESRSLAGALLSRVENLPAMVRELIVGNADGNPFYMEEFTQMLIDDGTIVVDPVRWRVVADKLLVAHLPTTLAGVLQARLDSLPIAERTALSLASVVGHVFWEDALANLDCEAVRALPALAQRDLSQRHETTAFEGTAEYVFKHHALHQLAYDSVLKRHRRRNHELTALWLVARSGDRLNEHAGLIAEHWERAGEPARAALHRHRAAEHALQRFALDAALVHAERGLALTPAADLPQRYALTLVQCEAFARKQLRDAQLIALDELERLADRLDDDLKRSQAAERRAAFFIAFGEFALALEPASRALMWARDRDDSIEARAHNAVTVANVRLGQYAIATTHAQIGLALARKSGDRTAHANLLQNMGMVLNETGAPIEAAGCFEEALALCNQAGDRFGECRVLNSLSDIRRSVGDYPAARNRMVELVTLCRQVGIRVIEGYAHLNLSLVLVNLGEPSQAREHADTARQILREVGDRWAEACSLVNAGHAHLALAEPTRAEARYGEALEMFEGLGAAHMALEPMAGLAAVALARGDTPGALARVDDILSRLASGTSLEGTDEPLRVRLSCFRVLHAATDPRAREVLAIAHAELKARAERITDPCVRNALLTAVPHHREIVTAWNATPAD